MKTLDRKLLRDLLSMKGQLIAIVMIIACGVACFVTIFTAYRGLKESRSAYYARYGMADVFASLERAPRSVLERLERIPGVRRAHGRIVFDVTLDLPHLTQPCSGRTVSVPDRHEPFLCDLHVVDGDWFDGDGNREVIVADRFARAHGIRVGDSLAVLMNNRKEDLRVVATALSPEYVYMIGGAGDVMPDVERFTILWLSESFAESVFGFEAAINDVVATIDRDANPETVIEAVDDELDRYGGINAIKLEDQVSNRFLSEEIEGLEGTVTVVPAVFLGIAAFVLHVLTGRLVTAQRSQIALLRAFGYGRREVGLHYLKFAAIVGGLGAIVGIGLGLLAARGILGIYQEFYDLPILVFDTDLVAVFGGAATSLVFAILGALGSVRAVSRLDPAEGMRPPVPSDYGRTLLERVEPIWSRLGFASRMVIRHVVRNPVRSLVTILGVSLATAIVLFSFFVFSAWDQLVDVQFRLVERQDASIQFHRKRGLDALYEMRRLEGVLLAEPELLVAATLVNGRHEYTTAIRGLSPDGELRALLDDEYRRVTIPESGLLLTRTLAGMLAVEAGDELEVRIKEGREPVLRVRVTQVVDEYLGTNVYCDIRTLSRWLGEEVALSGVLIRIDTNREAELGQTLKELPNVAGVSFKRRLVESLRDTVQESQQIMNYVVIAFAGVIAFGVLYNTARISLAQRGRELGSMRILGFSHREVGSVLAGEGYLLTAASVIPGLGLGVALCYALAKANQNELFTFPFVMPTSNLLLSIGVIFVFAVLANRLVLRRLRRADVIEVLKTGE